ncbi:MAG: tol-pal system protein YbgF [Candidatus Zixiibacteriota bacterium]
MSRSAAAWLVRLAGVVVCAITLAGCVSRAAMRRMQDQLDYLEASHKRMEADLIHIDSLVVLSTSESRRTRAEVATTLEEFRGDVGTVRETIDELRQTVERRPTTYVYAPPSTMPDTGTAGGAVTSAPPDADPGKMYEDAFLDVRKGNYELAIDQFRDILQYFGNSAYAPNSRYWIGECWYSLGGGTENQNDTVSYYDSAVVEFQRLIEDYPQSERVPTALYKLGRCSEELNHPRQARQYYERVIGEFPKSLEAKPAKSRLDELR